MVEAEVKEKEQGSSEVLAGSVHNMEGSAVSA
jgi:hypothetical protein